MDDRGRRCNRAGARRVSRGAADKEIVIGDQCDRTGATQIVGTVLCPAMQDYYQPDQLPGRRRWLDDPRR